MKSDIPSRGEHAPAVSRRRWGLIIAAIAGICVVLLLAFAAALYAERRLIAASFVQRYLMAYGIESDVEFDRLAWGGFLARVRAGPLAAPDFTADGVDVTLVYPDAASLVASVTPQVAAVRLIRPRMSITYDADKLSFGSLQGLIDEILAGASDVPGPEVTIEDGRLTVATPYGPLTLLADAAIDKSSLTRLNATVEPATLRDDTFAAEITGGTISASMNGEALNGRGSLSVASVTHSGRSVQAVEFSSDVSGLKWTSDGAGTEFTFDNMALTIGTGRANAPEFAAGRSALRIGLQRIEGQWANEKLRLIGRGDASGEFGDVRAAGGEAVNLQAETSLSAFSLDLSSGQWSAEATAHGTIGGSDARYPVSGGTIALGSLRSEFDSIMRIGADENSATFKGMLVTNGSLPEQIALRSLRADFDGETRNGNHRLDLNSLTANAGVTLARALALARQIPGVGSDEALVTSIATAFQTSTLKLRNAGVTMSSDGVTLSAGAPIVLEGAAARLSISPRGMTPLIRTSTAQTTGGFDLELAGNGLPQVRVAVASYRHRGEGNPTVLDADARLTAALSYGSFRGVDISGAGKLQVAGDRMRFDASECADLALASYVSGGADLVRNLKTRLCGTALQMSGDRVQFYLAGCADVTFAAFVTGGADQLRDAKGRLCAVPDRPILASQPSGWTLDARMTDAAATLVAGSASFAQGGARVTLSGDDVAIKSGEIVLDRAVLSDLERAPRFQPISAAGAMRADGDDWSGDFTLSLGTRRLASVSVKHAMDSGAGEANVSTRGLMFEPNMLQPADIAPFLSAFGSRVSGGADFSGRFSWSENGMASDGRLVIPSMDIQSPFGAVRQLKTEALAFASLIPFALRPAQTVTVGRIDVLVPLEQVSATFTYTPEALRLETAGASVALGRAVLDPMTYSFAPGATSEGTLRLQNVALEPLIEAAGLTDRMSVQARIDGVVPFTLSHEGVRFANGRIAANGPGRLSIKREALTASVGTGADAQAPPNAVQDFAYQALEHLAFDRLEGVVNSQPMGRLGVQLHIVGSNDPPEAAEARVGIIDLLRGRAFDRPLPLPKATPIDLTLDTSINLDELLESYLNRRGGADSAAMTP